MHNHLTPARLIPPSRTIKREIDARQWNPADMARMTELPLSMVDELLKGQQTITENIAKTLANAFGTSAHFWINLQDLFNERNNRRTNLTQTE